MCVRQVTRPVRINENPPFRLGQTSATFRPTNPKHVGNFSALLDIVGCRGGQTNPTFHPIFVDLQQKQPEA